METFFVLLVLIAVFGVMAKLGFFDGEGFYVVAVVFLLFVGWVIVTAIWSGKPTSPEPPPPARLAGIVAGKIDRGFFTTDFSFKNETKAPLLDVTVTLTLRREDGEIVPVKKYWARWNENEDRTFSAPSASYQKMSLEGTATSYGKSSRIDSTWTLGPK